MGTKAMLSFFFYLLSHEPVKDARIILSTHSLSFPIPSYQAFSGPFFYLLLHFSSFMQQAHSKDLALGPYCHLDELSHDFYWNLAIQAHVRKCVHIQSRDQEWDYTGTPMTDILDYRLWILRILRTWLLNENICL